MTPDSNHSVPEAKSSASFISSLVCETQPFEGSFEELSLWLDEELKSLESKFADFCTPNSFLNSLGR